MTQIVSYEDPADLRIQFLFRCGKCQVKAVDSARIVTEGTVKFVEFRCHGEIELREVSDAMLRSRRLQGYMPFSSKQKTSTKDRSDAMDAFSYLTRSFPFPMCGRCNKPVNSASSYRNELNRSTIIEVQCHGQSQSIPIDDYITQHPEFPDILRSIVAFSNQVERPSPLLNRLLGELWGKDKTSLEDYTPPNWSDIARSAIPAAIPPEPSKPKVTPPSLLIPEVGERVITFED